MGLTALSKRKIDDALSSLRCIYDLELAESIPSRGRLNRVRAAMKDLETVLMLEKIEIPPTGEIEPPDAVIVRKTIMDTIIDEIKTPPPPVMNLVKPSHRPPIAPEMIKISQEELDMLQCKLLE